MKKKERLKEQGIEIIGKEMWVWDDKTPKNAFYVFVILKNFNLNKCSYLTRNNADNFFFYENASETNPNEVKQQFKVGDKVKVAKMLGKEGFIWHTELNDTLGEIGIVSEVFESMPDRVKVKISNTEYCHLNESLELVDDSPKVGDVGFFWDEFINSRICYGKIVAIQGTNSKFRLSGTAEYFTNFSQTPPEIK